MAEPSDDKPSVDKNVPVLVGEAWQLTLTYLKQETVEPIKGLGRLVAFGVAGSFALAIGLSLLLLAGLRALQTETTSTFTGNLTWAPYGIAASAALVLAVASAAAIRRRSGPRSSGRSVGRSSDGNGGRS